ncbi:ABC transporter ATP-binding protein [Staphylococcus sp. Marseille-Q5304]|uniref:ABC transporter ATP-binding protein n=1 Tax=Staphylococcus sp. Marseille-Q5304 TaxID=2942200 RepID=UPI0020741760|nr:ABC transporter ATP-binding protein [Staphylococcus sp. Marseille-Q5304]
MIKLDSISKSFNNTCILNNLSLAIEEKAFVVIKGKSGQGKSTLLNILGLLEPPTEGLVRFKNQSITSKSQIRKLKKEDIAYIYQNYGLLENKTVLANLMLPLNISKKDTPQIIKTIQSVGLSKEILKRKVYTCSGGEQQRIAIARAILKKPTVILADEPTGNLDENNARDVINIFQSLNRKGVTIIMATHNESYFKIGTKLIDLDVVNA